MSSIPWDDFRLVQMIAEHRTLHYAADALAINHSTVFRRLNTLEERLGVRLFERSRTGYDLTTAGEEMVNLARQMNDSIIDFERRIAGQDIRPAGELHVTTTDTTFTHLVAPVFHDFRERYPEITLDVTIDNRTLNLARRDADVAIRASSDPPASLVGRRIATIAWAAYIAEGEFARLTQKNVEGKEFLSPPARWIGFGEPLTNIAAGRWMTANVNPKAVVFKLNMLTMLVSAISAGLGIGLLPCFIGDQTGGLRRLPNINPDSKAGLWLLTHPDIKKAARVRAFLDFFGSELSKKRKIIEGKN